MDIRNEVLKVLDETAAAGEKTPSLRAIRARLGRGSLTTISEVVKGWKAGHLPGVTELPETLPPEASRLITAAVWHSVKPMLKDRISAVQKEADEKIAIEKTAAAELVEAAKEKLSEAAKKEAELLAAKTRAEKLEKRLAAAEKEIELLKADRKAAEDRETKLRAEVAAAQSAAAAAAGKAAALSEALAVLQPGTPPQA